MSDAAPPPGGEEPGSLRALAGWRHEALLALELVALCAFAVARPLLDSFGRSPETFLARGAEPRTIVAFGAVLLLVPPLALIVPGFVARAAGPRARWAVHLALVAVAGGVGAWRLLRDVVDWEAAGAGTIAVGAVAGLAVGLLRLRLVPARAFLRVAGVASVLYVVLFAVASPTAQLVVGDQVAGVEPGVAAAVADDLGEDPPNVVVLVLDALPTETLLDGTGHIDPRIFPNLARLADTGTWYRNNTTVSMFTRDALPAILTGRFPDPANDESSAPAEDPDNLFTLLGGSYDLSVVEQITRLCPEDLCARPESDGLGPLLGDAARLWRGEGAGTGGDGGDDRFALPAVLDGDRWDDMAAWIDEVPLETGGRPDLLFYHAALPHDPWQYLPDGTRYEAERFPVGYADIGWYGPGIEAGRRRHVIQAQAADALVGRMLDRLLETGTLDDTMVVVTADHGHAFVDDEPWRWLSVGNHDQLMWAPLLVKAPGQTEGEIVDDNVMSIDIAPTIAAELGVDIPWDVDGRPADRVGDRDPDLKFVDDDPDNLWRAAEGETLVQVRGAQATFEQVMAADPVPADGPDAPFRRTAHAALTGRRVEDLEVGDRPDGEAVVEVEAADDVASVDEGEPLPVELLGRAVEGTGPDGPLAVGAVVAYVVDGRVAGLTEVEEDVNAPQPLVEGLALPDLVGPGSHELEAYLVDGPVGQEVLRPIEVR